MVLIYQSYCLPYKNISNNKDNMTYLELLQQAPHDLKKFDILFHKNIKVYI